MNKSYHNTNQDESVHALYIAYWLLHLQHHLARQQLAYKDQQ